MAQGQAKKEKRGVATILVPLTSGVTLRQLQEIPLLWHTGPPPWDCCFLERGLAATDILGGRSPSSDCVFESLAYVYITPTKNEEALKCQTKVLCFQSERYVVLKMNESIQKYVCEYIIFLLYLII